jgi:putative ABC transport system ATP-binding protein
MTTHHAETAGDGVLAAQADAGTVLVDFAELAKTYGTGSAAVVAVHGATGSIVAGARVALVGPSGSGKSTLLHLLAGLEEPTAGAIERPCPGVGLVFQGPSLLPSLDVAENVALPLLLDGHPQDEADRRARHALRQLRIGDLAAAMPDTLSGGQAQRVAIARALARRPLLILADEPTGQVDRRTADLVVDVLVATAAEIGAALVVATHDPAVAGTLTEQWHMTDGRLDTGLFR